MQKDPALMERIKLFAEEYALKNSGRTPSMTMIGSRFGISRSGAFGYLKANGNSMKDAKIDNGDLVICRKCEEAREEDIVVAYIRGSGSTLKRYKRDKKGPYLWAENNSWSDKKRRIGREFDVQGVAIKVIKNL